MRYLIAYDIAEDHVRTVVAEAIDDYGIRVQKSVFECEVDGEQLSRLRVKLAAILAPPVIGNVRVYGLCERCAANVSEIGARPGEVGSDKWLIL